MDFPLIDLMDEHACSARLRALRLCALPHPDGLTCPKCGAGDRLGVHRRHRDPVLDYPCGHCGRVFNTFTATPLQGIRRSPAQLLLILRGVAQAAPTALLARELGCDR
jgi:transposase-like protein